jgi:hypothetical protein
MEVRGIANASSGRQGRRRRLGLRPGTGNQAQEGVRPWEMPTTTSYLRAIAALARLLPTTPLPMIPMLVMLPVSSGRALFSARPAAHWAPSASNTSFNRR